MSFKGYQKSPFRNNSPQGAYSNNQGRNSGFNTPNSSMSMPGWGTPAVGYSPRGNNVRGSPYSQYSPRGYSHSNNGQSSNSPRGYNPSNNGQSNSSPRGQHHSQNRSFNTSSPRSSHNTPNNVASNRFSSPNDVFKTPQSPLHRSYSSPATYSFNNSGGNRQYSQRFQQNSRRGRNFTPRGSCSIEDYYHKSMVEDPWKFTPPVPVQT